MGHAFRDPLPVSEALWVVRRLGCSVQRVGAVDPAHERGQPAQGQVNMLCVHDAITELQFFFWGGVRAA